jgi:hypothetical protein
MDMRAFFIRSLFLLLLFPICNDPVVKNSSSKIPTNFWNVAFFKSMPNFFWFGLPGALVLCFKVLFHVLATKR